MRYLSLTLFFFAVSVMPAQQTTPPRGNFIVTVGIEGDAYGIQIPGMRNSWDSRRIQIPHIGGPAPKKNRLSVPFILTMKLDDVQEGELGDNCTADGLQSRSPEGTPVEVAFKVRGQDMDLGNGRNFRVVASRDITSGVPRVRFLLTDPAGSRITIDAEPDLAGRLPENVICDWRQRLAIGPKPGDDEHSSFELENQPGTLRGLAHGTMAIRSLSIERSTRPVPPPPPPPVTVVIPRPAAPSSATGLEPGVPQVHVVMTGSVGDGPDNLGIFGGGNLFRKPFTLAIDLEDKAGGAIGSNCTLPDGDSRSSDTAPSRVVLTVGAKSYEFGKRADFYALAYRHAQGMTPHLVGMHFMVLQGNHIRDHKADANQSSIDVWLKPPTDAPAPPASCDWRQPLTMSRFEPHDAGFKIVGSDGGGEFAAGPFFVSSITITRTGVTEAENLAPAASAPAINKDNPMIGYWTARNKDSIRVPADVEYTATEQIVNGSHWKVTYAISGNDITVIPKGNLPRTCTMRGVERMVCHTEYGDFEMIRLK